MSTTTTPARVEGTNVVVLQAPTLQWALKRTLLGIVILFVTIAAAATLLYASIDPEEESASGVLRARPKATRLIPPHLVRRTSKRPPRLDAKPGPRQPKRRSLEPHFSLNWR